MPKSKVAKKVSAPKKRKKPADAGSFTGKKIGKLSFGTIKEDDLLGEDHEIFAGCLPTSPSTTCSCSTYYS